MTVFRVHFIDGTRLEITADTPKEARDLALKQHAGKISKIKVKKGEE